MSKRSLKDICEILVDQHMDDAIEQAQLENNPALADEIYRKQIGSESLVPTLGPAMPDMREE